MRAKRPHEVRWVEVRHRFEPLLHALRQVHAVAGEGDLAECLGLVGRALDVEASVFENDVFLGRLEHVGGQLLALVDDLAGRPADGHAADRQTAAAVRAVAERCAFGRVAVPELDAVVGNPELVRDDLRKGRLVALAV